MLIHLRFGHGSRFLVRNARNTANSPAQTMSKLMLSLNEQLRRKPMVCVCVLFWFYFFWGGRRGYICAIYGTHLMVRSADRIRSVNTLAEPLCVCVRMCANVCVCVCAAGPSVSDEKSGGDGEGELRVGGRQGPHHSPTAPLMQRASVK